MSGTGRPRVTARRAAFAGALASAAIGALRLFAAEQSASPPPTPPSAPASASSAAETPACADCHEEAKPFSRSAHARIVDAAGKRLTGDALCISCHGESSAHVATSGEKPVARPLGAGDDGAFCATCHTPGGARHSFSPGVHAFGRSANCLSCHRVHATAPGIDHLLSRPVAELCASCHPGPAASLRDKPFTHRLSGGLDCESCHDAHGKRRDAGLRRTAVVDLPCVSCHAEKRGPFVFPHVVPGEGNCLSCHEPHGSSNPKQLTRARVDQLCLECHSTLNPSTLGSQPPSFHDLTLPRYQNCTVCHTAVHGSNRSPSLLR